MQQLRTGEMLRRFRIEKEISEEKLGFGVCCGTTISNYEVGSRHMDTVLFEFFLERMGVSPENFAFMLSEEEYTYYMWKAEVYEAVEKADWEVLEKLLLSEKALFFVGNKKVQKQFYLYMKAILMAEKFSNYESAANYLLDGIQITIDDIYHISLENRVLSVRELHMLILYLHYSLCAGTIEDLLANKLFSELEKYILSSYLDIKEKSKIYPKLVCVWINLQKEYLSDYEKIRMCKRAIEILKEGLQFNDILEVFRVFIPLLKENSEEYFFFKKQYEVFVEIFNYAEVEEKFRPEFIIRKIPKIYVITEYLRYKRKEMNLTQDKLSEGICEPETYSRIERGKRAPSPSNRKALTERLNIGWHYFRGELDTDSLEVYKLRGKQRVAEIKENWHESFDILQKMRKLLDMDSVFNLQYIVSNECNALYHLMKMEENEFYNKLRELLFLTNKIDICQDQFVYYSQVELEILGEMAKILRKRGDIQEAAKLIDSVIGQMSQSKVSLLYQWDGVDFLQRIRAGLYYSEGKYREGYVTRKEVYKVAVRERNAGNLPIMLDGMADDLEHIGKEYRNEYMNLYRQTYYVSDFYEMKNIRDFARKYYEKFEKQYQWY